MTKCLKRGTRFDDRLRPVSEFCQIWASLGGLPTTGEEEMACLFLESKGLRFCIDYGYQNAIAKAQCYPEWAGARYVIQ